MIIPYDNKYYDYGRIFYYGHSNSRINSKRTNRPIVKCVIPIFSLFNSVLGYGRQFFFNFKNYFLFPVVGRIVRVFDVFSRRCSLKNIYLEKYVSDVNEILIRYRHIYWQYKYQVTDFFTHPIKVLIIFSKITFSQPRIKVQQRAWACFEALLRGYQKLKRLKPYIFMPNL